MGLSRRIIDPTECECGHLNTPLVWIVLHVAEHPEVAADPSGVSEFLCGGCGQRLRIMAPLLVFNLRADLPVVSCPAGDDRESFGPADVAAVTGETYPPPPGLVVSMARVLVGCLLETSGELLVDELEGVAQACPDLSIELAQLESELRGVQHLRGFHAAFFASLEVGSPEDMAQVLADHPVIATAEFVEFVQAVRAQLSDIDPEECNRLQMRILVFEDLGRGVPPAEAWARGLHIAEKYVVERLFPELERIYELLDSPDAQDPAARSGLFDRAIDIARAVGDTAQEVALRQRRAMETLGDRQFFATDELAATLADLAAVRELTRETDPKTHAEACSTTAMVLSKISFGDRGDNIERAIGLIDEALAYYDESSDPDYWAMSVVNKALLLTDRESGEARENLRSAVSLCRDSLRVRSPERNLLDWAFSITNLAFVLTRQVSFTTESGEKQQQLLEAIDLYEDARKAYGTLGLADHEAYVRRNRAYALLDLVEVRRNRSRRRIAAELVRSADEPEIRELAADQGSFDDVAENLARFVDVAQLNPRVFGSAEVPSWATAIMAEDLDSGTTDLIQSARQDAEAALALHADTPGAGQGPVHLLLGRIVEMSAAPDEDSIVHFGASLDYFKADGMRREVLSAAGDLGAIHARRGDWAAAAEVYSLASTTLDQLYGDRGTAEGRELELSGYPKLAEWTGYALAKAGRLDEAVLVIEKSRARVLGSVLMRDEADLNLLDSLDHRLAERFRQRRERLRQAQLMSSDQDSAQQELDDVVSEIRLVPGLANFMLGTSPVEIAMATRPSRPLIYVISTAAGTVCLLARAGDRDDGSVLVDLVSDNATSSADLVRCLSAATPDGWSGLLFSNPVGLSETLGELQALLGRAFANDLAAALHRIGAREVAIVPAGMLSAFPLGTALIDDPGRGWLRAKARFLSDVAAVTVAPSAMVLNACERRVQRLGDRPPLFAGVGNPQEPDEKRRLSWAGDELRAVNSLYHAEAETIRVGEQATRAFLLGVVRDATHLHFSCHGTSDLENPARSALLLADGSLAVEEISERMRAEVRLVVASACESGKFGVLGKANEYVGLAGAFLTAGAAAVVASLWPVNDLATCLLMVKFHELHRELERDGARAGSAAIALVGAQRWLRTLSGRQLEKAIRGYFAMRSKRADQDRSRLRLGGQSQSRGLSTRRPFSDPRYWAPFVVVGL